MPAAPWPELAELTDEIVTLAKPRVCASGARSPATPAAAAVSSRAAAAVAVAHDPQRALRCAAAEVGRPFDPNLSGDYSTTDMVNRLEPVEFHWIESSPAEQEFLGWTLAELRAEVVPRCSASRRPHASRGDVCRPWSGARHSG